MAAYERALVRRHALELQPLALHVQKVKVAAEALERGLDGEEKGSLAAQIPLFFGSEVRI